MNKRLLEWKVGLFVLIGLLLLAVLLLEFSKGLTFFRPTYNINLHSSNVGGLKVRAAVLMSGVQVGTVSDIKLIGGGRMVSIDLRVYSRYDIYRDARFVIEQSGFLGDQYVSIIPTENKAPKFENGQTAEAEAPFNIQEFTRSASGFVQRIDDTAKRLNDALVDVRRLVLNPETLSNLSVSVANLRTFSEHATATVDNLDALITTNTPALTQSGSNLLTFTADLHRFGDGLNSMLQTNSPDINLAVKNLESSTESLKTLMADAQAGKGLAGSLLKNEQLAATVSQIAINLSITTSNLNRLGLWGILWQHKPHTAAASPEVRPLTTPKGLPD